MHLHATLCEQPLGGSDLQVVIRVVSVFARPGESDLLPDAVGADDLRRWLATHDPVNR